MYPLNPGKYGNGGKRRPKLLGQVRNKIRLKYYSIRNEESYLPWIRRFILFHNKKRPMDMGENEIEQFWSDLAVSLNVVAFTQSQALSAFSIIAASLKYSENSFRVRATGVRATVWT